MKVIAPKLHFILRPQNYIIFKYNMTGKFVLKSCRQGVSRKSCVPPVEDS